MLQATDETGSAAPNPHDSPQLDNATAMDMGTDSSGGQPDQYLAQKQWATKQQGMRRHNLNVAETRSQRRAQTIADPKNPTRRQINRHTEHQEALRTGQSKRRKKGKTKYECFWDSRVTTDANLKPENFMRFSCVT